MTSVSGTRPIGWRAASRILKGHDGGPGTEDLRAFIEIASASAPTSTSTSPSSGAIGAMRAETEPAGREAMLTAFRENAAVAQPARRMDGRKAAHSQKSVRSRRTSGAVVLRFTTAILLVCGVGAAAASAGVLPAGVQRIAHDYFGIGGVSAPSTHVPSSGAGTSGSSNGGGAGSNAAIPQMTNGVMPTNSTVMVTLCQQVAKNGNWKADLNAADQATLTAAAGGEHKVKGFCTRLLAGVGKGATPSPDVSGTPAATPSVEPTETHGNAHVSHSPDTHSTAH